MDEWAISIQMLSYKNLMNPDHHISSYVPITFVFSMKNQLQLLGTKRYATQKLWNYLYVAYI
jgi:hypothetical protein